MTNRRNVIERIVSAASLIRLSPVIRGDALKEDEVLLTLTRGGILVSPYHPGAEDGKNYAARSKFSKGLLYLPVPLLSGAKIRRRVTVTIQEDGTLFLEPGERCVVCGSRKELHAFNPDIQICQSCLKKAVRF